MRILPSPRDPRRATSQRSGARLYALGVTATDYVGAAVLTGDFAPVIRAALDVSARALGRACPGRSRVGGIDAVIAGS